MINELPIKYEYSRKHPAMINCHYSNSQLRIVTPEELKKILIRAAYESR